MFYPVITAFVLNRVSWEDFARAYGDADFWEPVNGKGSVIGGEGVREGDRKIRELIGENSRRVDQGEVNDGRPLAVIIACRSPRWNPFRVLYVETLFVKPVYKLICPWGLAGMGKGPIYGVCVKVAHEERGCGLVEFGCEDVRYGMVAWFVSGDLVVDVYETESLITDDDIEHHGGWGCDGMGEVIDDGN